MVCSIVLEGNYAQCVDHVLGLYPDVLYPKSQQFFFIDAYLRHHLTVVSCLASAKGEDLKHDPGAGKQQTV